MENGLWFPGDRDFGAVVAGEVAVGEGGEAAPVPLHTGLLLLPAPPPPKRLGPIPILPKLAPAHLPTAQEALSEDMKRVRGACLRLTEIECYLKWGLQEIALEALAELKAQFRRHRGGEEDFNAHQLATSSLPPTSRIACKICQARYTRPGFPVIRKA